MHSKNKGAIVPQIDLERPSDRKAAIENDTCPAHRTCMSLTRWLDVAQATGLTIYLLPLDLYRAELVGVGQLVGEIQEIVFDAEQLVREKGLGSLNPSDPLYCFDWVGRLTAFNELLTEVIDAMTTMQRPMGKC